MPAPGGYTRIDPPFHRHPLHDGEPAGLVAIADDSHVDDLLAVDNRDGLQACLACLLRVTENGRRRSSASTSERKAALDVEDSKQHHGSACQFQEISLEHAGR